MLTQPIIHPDILLSCQVALEDSLVGMSTILSSRYVGGIRPEVERVERQLSTFSDTLDQWVQVRGGRRASQWPKPLVAFCPSEQNNTHSHPIKSELFSARW